MSKITLTQESFDVTNDVTDQLSNTLQTRDEVVKEAEQRGIKEISQFSNSTIPLPTYHELPPWAQEYANDQCWFFYFGSREDGKINKAPRNPVPDRGKYVLGRTDQRDTAGTFTQAYNAAKKHNGGVGINLGHNRIGSLLVGIDIDSCFNMIDGEHSLHPWASEVLNKFNSYAEISPSGTGIKIFCQSSKVFGPNVTSKIYGASGKHPPAVDLFLTGKYFTLTGQRFGSTTELREISKEEYNWFVNDFKPRFTRVSKKISLEKNKLNKVPVESNSAESAEIEKIQSALRTIDPNKISYDEWIRIGMSLYSVDLRDEWLKWSARYVSSNQEENEAKWESFKNSRREIQIGSLFFIAQRFGWNDNNYTENHCKNQLNIDLNKLNQNYFYVSEEGKSTVLSRRFNNKRGRYNYTRQTTTDFKKDHMSKTYPISSGNKVKLVELGDAWLHWPKRKQFLGGVVFDPSSTSPYDDDPDRAILNLWDGFGVVSSQGDCSKFLEHLRDIICCGNTKNYDYLIKWLARAVQKPELQGEVAIVLRGKKGTGKSIVGRTISKLFGSHGCTITNTHHLTGKHNEHLQCTVFLFIEEAPFAGDFSNEHVLKGLITDSTFIVEPKFRKAVETENYLHILMSSNENHVVRASDDERRYFVLDVNDARVGDFAYFENLHAELEAGGYSALLHYLQNVDIADFNVRSIPQTEGLARQKEESLPLEQKWLHYILSRGYFCDSKLGCDSFEEWFNSISCNLVIGSYENFVRPRGKLAYGRNHNQIGKILQMVGFERQRISAAGTVLMGETIDHNNKPSLRMNVERAYAYRCEGLDYVRKAFCELVGFEVIWPHSDEVDEERLSVELQKALYSLKEAKVSAQMWQRGAVAQSIETLERMAEEICLQLRGEGNLPF